MRPKQKDAIKALKQVSVPAYHLIVVTTFLLILAAIGWGFYFEIDEVVEAEGKIIPSQKIQLVQSLDNAIIKKIFVHEGEIVEKGQDLVLLDNTKDLSKFREQQTKSFYLQAKIARLTAEVNDKPFAEPTQLVKVIPEQVQSEMLQYEARKTELNNMQAQRKLLLEEFHMNQPLVAEGAVSRTEVIRIEQSIKELDAKIAKFRSDTLSELNQARSELASIKEALVGLEHMAQITLIKSPVKGIIKNIITNTIGGVVKSAGEIMEIVPLDDTLLIEAKVKPKDIGFLHPDLKTIVKITAYDYFTYGGLDGVVEHISADTIKSDPNDPGGTSITSSTNKNQIYYKVYVRTQKNYLGKNPKKLVIIPGMEASVNILVGKKSIMKYLLKPIYRVYEKALHEK